MTAIEFKNYNFTEEQLAKLITMQDELNTYIHPEWKLQNFDWNTAIIDECQEILEHLGWKWWKQGYRTGLTEANKAQIQLEVIDILHFLISLDAQEGVKAKDLLSLINTNSKANNIWATVDWMRNDAATGVATLGTWAQLAHSVDLTEQQILETYTQKFVLNKFRQDHGYKDGTYVKSWQSAWLGGVVGAVAVLREDNEVLAQVVKDMASDGEDTCDEEVLYGRLEARYNSRLNK